MLGKDLKAPDVVTSNTLYLINGKGNMTVETGEGAWIAKLYIIDYQDDVEYMWVSDNTDIAQVSKGMIMGVSPGSTHVKCFTRSGDIIADLTITVQANQAWRVEKCVALVSGVYYGALTIKDNFIYVGTSIGIQKARPEQNGFYKLDMDLNVVWRYDLGKLGVRGSAVQDSQGNIYFTVEDVREATSPDDANAIGTLGQANNINIHVGIFLYSLTKDGALRFKKDVTAKSGMYHVGMINCAMDKNDTLYIADCGLSAYDTVGNVKWHYPSDDEVIATRSSPVFDDKGNLYVLMGMTAYRFDAGSSGTPAWKTTLLSVGAWMDLSPPSFNTDYSRIYVPDYQTVYCLDTSTGAKVWQFKPDGIKGEFRANAAVDAEGNVYIGTKADRDSTLYSIKADGSGLLWQILVGGDLYCSPVLGDDGLLYVGSEASILGAFYAIEPATGDIIWGLSEMGDNENPGYTGLGWSSLRIQDGYVYCVSDYLCKIKIDANNYLPGAGWPTFRGANDDSGFRN
jgi:outer membrane protein assembly factor BamB